MRQLSTFQIIILGVFAALTLVGVGVFAASGGFTSGQNVGRVVIWGTTKVDTMQGLLDTLRPTDKAFADVTYVQKSPATYASELINAMAAGKGPDLFLVTQSDLQMFADKVLPISYSTVSQRAFATAYIDEAQLFLTPQGALALPFSIDPLVMYWNKDLFAAAGFANPPQFWNDFLIIAPKISRLDGSTTVKKSAVSLGQWSNIASAKEILSTLFMQAGDKVTARGADGALVSVLGSKSDEQTTEPATSALRFYTEFANPSKTTYSWNRSLPKSSDMFANGDLAVYFGFASEFGGFALRNPNLHYAVAPMPQIEGANVRVAYGRITGLAVPRTSSNPAGALTVAQKLSGQASQPLLAGVTNLPVVRRDVTLDTSQNAAMATFADSALIANAWLDPAPKETDVLFADMIESVLSGKSEPAAAVFTAAQELQLLVAK